MSLYDELDIDPDDVVENPCGMLNCEGPALRDTRHWLDVEATGSKQGEVVARGDTSVPLCAPHRLTWEVFFDTVPDDLLSILLGYLVDFERHKLSEQLVDGMRGE